MRTEMGKMWENIPEGVVSRWILSLSYLGLPSPHGDLLYSSPSTPSSAPFWNVQEFRAAILVAYRTSSTEPGGFALLAGDTSVDSWFREIHVPRAWCVYLATGFDFHEKIVLVFGGSEPNFGFSLLPCHFTMKDGRRRLFFPKTSCTYWGQQQLTTW